MFEVGFSEIVLILGLALLVLGPERLPELAAKVGRWTGRARAMARQFQMQLEQEVTLEKAAKSTPPIRYPDEHELTTPMPETVAAEPENSIAPRDPSEPAATPDATDPSKP
jgi:sec-independent protein translocase protein TatB